MSNHTRLGLRFALAYLGIGVVFGVILVRGEAVSWYRIQEMFRFQSFHMYGVLFSAIAVAAVFLRLMKRTEVRSLEGTVVAVPPKTLGRGTRYWAGGILFGMGWAFTGACPGPLFALVGSGVGVLVVTIASAVVGTWIYGHVRPKLPH